MKILIMVVLMFAVQVSQANVRPGSFVADECSLELRPGLASGIVKVARVCVGGVVARGRAITVQRTDKVIEVYQVLNSRPAPGGGDGELLTVTLIGQIGARGLVDLIRGPQAQFSAYRYFDREGWTTNVMMKTPSNLVVDAKNFTLVSSPK